MLTVASVGHIAPATPERPIAVLAAGLGTRLGSEVSPFSLMVAPRLELPLDKGWNLRASAQGERTFSPHVPTSVPYVRAGIARTLSSLESPWKAHGVLTLSALELERWSTDGAMGRLGLGIEAERELGSGFALTGMVQPWLQASAYGQRANGASLSSWGLQEGLGLRFARGEWRAEVKVLLEQSRRGVWHNDYAVSERLKWRTAEKLFLGISHELSAGVIDDGTGLSAPLRLASGRGSKFTAFAELEL